MSRYPKVEWVKTPGTEDDSIVDASNFNWQFNHWHYFPAPLPKSYFEMPDFEAMDIDRETGADLFLKEMKK